MATLDLWQERGASITHSIPKQKHHARTLASLPRQRRRGFFELGYEYFHLELGAVSSLI